MILMNMSIINIINIMKSPKPSKVHDCLLILPIIYGEIISKP